MSGDKEVLEMLRKGDWQSLKLFFGRVEPSRAEHFQARAFLRIQESQGQLLRWSEVISDLEHACRLDPENTAYRANLVQALIDSGQAVAAISEANDALANVPQDTLIREKLAIAATRAGEWQLAFEVLEHLKKLTGSSDLRHPLEDLFAQLSVRWWDPLRIGKVSLLQPDRCDLPFLTDCVANKLFMRLFHREKSLETSSIEAFFKTNRQSPYKSCKLNWIVKLNDVTHVGLAGLVDIDWHSRRAELVIGFPRRCGALTAIQTTFIVIDFAFQRLGVEKLVAFTYSDNSWASRNVVGLGFSHEGILRSHVVRDGERLDVNAFGLLKNDWFSGALGSRLSNRWNAC